MREQCARSVPAYDRNSVKCSVNDYCRVHNQQITLADHDGGGFGVKLNLIPYESEWFGIGGGNYQTEILERVCDSDDDAIRHGSAEVYLHGPVEDGSATLHLTVVEEVEVYDPDGVERWLGVDLGERALYASAFVGATSDQIEGVEVESGREYRHHRKRLKEKRRKLSQAGDLRGVRACRGEIERYTDHIVHVTSWEIVDQAASRVPCGIRLERLTGYREDAEDPIHDWPYAAIQSAICYKATGAGIPVEFVDPAGTSARCNRCGQPGNRDGDSFSCGRCDYAVDADVNGAINIARGGFE